MAIGEVPQLTDWSVVENGRRRRSGGASLWVGVGILGAVIVSAGAVRVFGLVHPGTIDFNATFAHPSFSHPFGTDALGQDVLGLTVYGSLTDLQVGVVTVILSMMIGVALGLVAGYTRGVVDSVIMRVTDFVLAFPFIVIVLALVTVFGGGLTGIYVGLVAKGWPTYTRLTRGEMLVLRERQFMLAAHTLGFSRRRIIMRHALPHCLRPNMVFALSDMLGNMLLLASLSYLGLGVRPPTPEWGSIIYQGANYLTTAWWIATLPGVFVVVVGLGLNLAGEGLAERFALRTGTVV